MRQTITQLLQSVYQQIDKLDADLLLSFVLGKPREYFMIHENEFVSNRLANKFNKLIKKRQSGIPLAYITGHKEFFGLDFLVSKHTLIPRPDTEIMVEEVVSHLQQLEHLQHFQPILIDIGTGTGCIPISILKTISTSSTFRTLNTFAIDISKKALEIARKNAKKHKAKIKFLHGNLLKPILNSPASPRLRRAGKFPNIIITANLPYLTEEQYQSEKSIQSEPKSALVAKKEGLALYEKLLKQIKSITKNYKLKAISYKLFLEIDPSQSEKIKILINKILPGKKIEIKKDLAGRERVVIIS